MPKGAGDGNARPGHTLIRRMWGNGMKKQLNLLCSIIALFCFVSMFIPIIAPRFAAGPYYSGTGNAAGDYFFTGDYYYAREYWSISRYVFSTGNLFYRIIVSLSEALLIYWAYYGVRGEAGKVGLTAAILNLVVNAAAIVSMLGVMGSCRWGVLAVLAVDAIVAVVLAILAADAK